MSSSNGVIRIGRKGIVKFSFSEEGGEFSVDVVAAFQEWVSIDDGFRQAKDGEEILDSERQSVRLEDMASYHSTAVQFVQMLGGPGDLTVAEALDFIARLREQYDAVADFFVPRSQKKRGSPGSSEMVSLEFSEEPAAN